jgi:hypothetical protein
MKRFLQFPELLLLLILLFCGVQVLPLSFAIGISWVFHVVLRSKYPANYPAFGSWAHVFLTALCILLLKLLIYQVDTKQETGQSEINGIINAFIWVGLAGPLVILLWGFQVVFWLAAMHSLWKRGKDRRLRRSKGPR